MISAGYKSAYQQGYSDAKRDFRKEESDDKLALLEKTYADFCKCESGEGWLRIDGIDYYTDVGYALEGMKIFMEVFKQRLAEKEGGK